MLSLTWKSNDTSIYLAQSMKSDIAKIEFWKLPTESSKWIKSQMPISDSSTKVIQKEVLFP